MTARETPADGAGERDTAVLYEARDGAAWITFNRPAQLNAFDLALAQGFREAVTLALRDEDVRVIVVRADGRSFSAGGDLGYLQAAQDKPGAALSLIEPFHATLGDLARTPKIVLGSLKGAVAGGGMSLALNLDLLIAADDSVFNFAYGRIGTSPDCGGSWALPRLVGLRRALSIALLSESIDAQEALSLGLVNSVVPREALDEETGKLAARLARGAPVAQGHIKALLRASLDNGYDAQLAREAVSFAACARTQDFAQALAAFIDKRKPVFHGR
ncbi:enoyl-CoA hydratase/isomerase family protein [Pseudochelatococcus lubricantis]|uniref:enoyl-CoA hydratase/isomerase family protein n=1 Tax=Pseudochelatococcus lubricantis TaxID=1538102 RepID=UPI0035EFB924